MSILKNADLKNSSLKMFDYPKKSLRSHGAALEKTTILEAHKMYTPTALLKRKTLPRTSLQVSKRVDGIQHKESIKAKDVKFKNTCPNTQKPFIGNCSLMRHATDMNINKKVFTLIEDPRRGIFFRNHRGVHSKVSSVRDEQTKITEMVKTAENIATSSESQSTISSICEAIDIANPLNLDFQGMDYKNTYMNDEQSFQNQMEYRKVRRVKHRQNVKTAVAVSTKISQQDERLAIPKHFEVNNTIHPELVSHPGHNVFKLNAFGKLIRGKDKPEVKQRLKQENFDRIERYKLLYLREKGKNEKTKEEPKVQEKKKLLEYDIENVVQILDRTIVAKKMMPRETQGTTYFPHNLKETIKFRSGLKKSKRIFRNRAKTKHEFYKQIARPKRYNEVELEISSDSPSPSVLSEVHSTNDEDDMEVGRQGSNFFLRGFLYKVGANLRGKLNQSYITERGRKVKGCMTRDEWFQTLVSNNMNNKHVGQPRPGKELFLHAKGLQQMVPKSSIREFRKRLVRSYYDQTMQRKVRLKKIRQIKVKKFNLINYLYGIGSKRRFVKSLSSVGDVGSSGKTLEFIRKKAKQDEIKRHAQKRCRIRYLRIPLPNQCQARSKFSCTNSESDDSDWVPDNTCEQNTVEHFNLRSRGNMPASENRESTLRCHPRHPRDYKDLRIDSAIFDETVRTSQVPILKKLKDDKYILENVREVKKTDFGKKFEARHHHDHWDPTQHKCVHINYARKVIRPKHIVISEKKKVQKISKLFDKAHPRESGHDKEVNCALSKLNTAMFSHNFIESSKVGSAKTLHLQHFPCMQDTIYKSLKEEKLYEFPGRKKFIEFLTDIKMTFNNRARVLPDESSANKNTYLDHLKDDLKSIDSCISSLSSSICTNLTNESGSFLLAGNKKIPLDYIRKSLVPFEEINRSLFESVPIEAAKEKENPFRTVQFAGQEMEQTISAAPTDNFFTFTTRLQNGKRSRLEVKQRHRQNELLGTGRGFKGSPQVVNDIDELYIKDLKIRPSPKSFKFNSCHTMIKGALRKKFESVLNEGEMVRTKIYDRRNEDFFQEMLIMKMLLENLFPKWEKKEYEAAMEVVNKVKPYYEATDRHKRELQKLEKQYTLLNMEIVFIENDWTRRIILQNFHYLLADMEWRIEHDWIHRMEHGELEGFDESIAKRNITNIRQRDKDDAWTIKHFYDNIYLQRCHPVNFVFNNTEDFVNGIVNLKSKTFVLLLELHYTLWILADLNERFEEFKNWCSEELELKKTYAENKSANKYFMKKRATHMKKNVYLCLGEPIETTFSNNDFCLMKGVCMELYKDVVPASSQMNVITLQQIAMISQVLTDLIGSFEVVSPETRYQVEKRYRRFLSYRSNLSKQTVLIERRIASEMANVRRNLSHPLQNFKRKEKPLRSKLKKIVKVGPQKTFRYETSQNITSIDREFCKEKEKGHGSFDVVDGFQKSIVPFYFDHFLSINGYQPNYNFKSQIELRDGPEINRFQIKILLPDVLEKFEKWQTTKKKVMDENINKNPKMYHNIQM